MAFRSFSLCFLFALISFSSLSEATYPGNGLILTLVNNCPYPIWPAIQPNAGHPVPERGGFFLPSLSHRSFPAPTQHWSGRVWARTGCVGDHTHLTCQTGDCGGKLECNGAGGKTPATLAQFSLHHGHKDFSSYGVSLVDGFNIPLTVTPHEGQGVCPVVGCKANLLESCPRELQVHAPHRYGQVIACKSGCEAVNNDQLCCRGYYNSPVTCKPSSSSLFFKHACPSTFTYAHDTPSLMHECAAPPLQSDHPPMVFGAITNTELSSVHHWSSNSRHAHDAKVSEAVEKRVYKKPSVPNPTGNHRPPSRK